MIGKTCQRGSSFSTWIRFGGKGLTLLVEGVEVCCADEGGKPFRKDWVEGGRNYKVVLCSNRALYCNFTGGEEVLFSIP